MTVTYPGRPRHQKKTFRTSLHWKAALLTESPVNWEKALHVLIMLQRADGFTVTSFVVFALKALTNRKRSVCRIAAHWVFVLTKVPCLGENLQFFPLAVVEAIGGNNASV